jgi:major type 1 subunit fimbrin (pilin)
MRYLARLLTASRFSLAVGVVQPEATYPTPLGSVASQRGRWWLLAAALLLLMSTGQAFAGVCTPTRAYTVSTVNLGTVQVPADLPVGGVIGVYYGSPADTTTMMNPACNIGHLMAGATYFRWDYYKRAPPYDILNTNVPGIGIAIFVDILLNGSRLYLPIDARLLGSPYEYGIPYNGTMGIILIRTAVEVGSGTLDPQMGAQIRFQGNQGGAGDPDYQMQLLYVGGGTIIPPGPPVGTCSMATGDVNRVITLPDVSVSAFTGVTSSAGATPFTITATNCENVNTVTFTFSGTSDPNDSYRWKSTGTAQGLGVQLATASDSATIRANGTNNTRVVPVSNKQAALGLVASYWQTSAKVSAGTVSAIATVILNYN